MEMTWIEILENKKSVILMIKSQKAIETKEVIEKIWRADLFINKYSVYSILLFETFYVLNV